MHNTKKIQTTQKGYDALKLELDELVDLKRPKLVERLERARNEGDLTENSDYTSAKEELEFLDGRIDELKYVLDNAVIIKTQSANGKVALGTKVILQFNGNKIEYDIVGEWEADPMKKKISHESPLGRELVGKRIGDIIKVEAPAGAVEYKIVDIK
jgi:transcription elongation factor GreA